MKTKEITRKDKMFLAAMGIVAIIGILMPHMKAFAAVDTSKPYHTPSLTYTDSDAIAAGIESNGRIEISSGIVFDASDIHYLYTLCK